MSVSFFTVDKRADGLPILFAATLYVRPLICGGHGFVQGIGGKRVEGSIIFRPPFCRAFLCIFGYDALTILASYVSRITARESEKSIEASVRGRADTSGA